MNYKDRTNDITFLTRKLSISVIEVEVGETSLFFATNDFEPPSIGSVISSPYLTFSGVDITEFLENSVFNQGSPELYRERFVKLNDYTENNNYKFSDKHVWRHYS
jgi:hypothetical protein